MASKSRWYVAVYLQSLHTLTSGDAFSKEGEWYFTCNGQRFPHKGHIKLGKNETFDPPEPKPTLFTTMIDGDKDPLVLNIKVKEEDPLKDDVMLEGSINCFYENKDKDFELKSKDGKVTLKVRVKVMNNNAW